MAKYVLVSDATLACDYRNFPLLQFLPCAPGGSVPWSVYKFLKGPYPPPLPNREASHAPYSIRKLEAALLKRNPRESVAVPHEDFIEGFIKDDTEIIAVSTMDPLGLGPLTMSYNILFNSHDKPLVRVEWERLIARLNAARRGKKAKIVVGGPGVWEFTTHPEELQAEGIDYAFQGEADDVVCELFEQLPLGNLDTNLFATGYVTIDDSFHRSFVQDPRFVTRRPSGRTSAPLEEIPEIVRPSVMGLVETMRGCGIGCDFCEVTLRPLRYYSVEKIAKEIEVNIAQGGSDSAWLHTDEIFAYRHENARFEPNHDALAELFTGVMAIKGVTRTNPTHGRISIPAGYPEMMKRLSGIMHAGPGNWIGVQVGVETGSDRLAKIHMPNKTLPLHIGPDGTWHDIVWKGTEVMNRNYWRPAFTVQCGQRDETPDDNWETVALINHMSNSSVDGRPFEFTITPMQNVPLGLIKSKGFSANMLDETQLAVYYASYRHLAKIAMRNAKRESRGNPVVKLGTAGIIYSGSWLMLKLIEVICRKRGVDIEKVKRHGLAN
ncbi:MAG: B12-binding domain-containing radical SAM protein [Candidatus Micrarchaeota archaeon]|nr:B12-binding domain-containing radical SAM protein [Candidatus Micrarchaeota archaeon]